MKPVMFLERFEMKKNSKLSHFHNENGIFVQYKQKQCNVSFKYKN